DPSVSVGSIVVRVIGNVVTDLAARPFDLLASLVPGGDALGDLSRVGFEAGSSEVPAEAMVKLEGLAAALEERPGLGVGLVGSVGPGDVVVLKRAALRERVKAEREAALATQPAGGVGAGVAEPGDPLEVARAEDAAYVREVVRLYLEARADEAPAGADGRAVDPPAVRGLPGANGGRGAGRWVYESTSRTGRTRGGKWVWVPAEGAAGGAAGEGQAADGGELGAGVVIGGDAEGKGGVDFAAAEAEVLETVELASDALAELAAARAEAVRAALAGLGVEEDRLTVFGSDELEEFQTEVPEEPVVVMELGA
ncbi:MAG: hypothetical protein AAGI68_13875, partial [Planctomycetota bacterium]